MSLPRNGHSNPTSGAPKRSQPCRRGGRLRASGRQVPLRFRDLGIVLLVWLASAHAALAQTAAGGKAATRVPASRPPADSLFFYGDAGQLDVPTPRLDEASIRIDGVLDDPEWGSAVTLAGFTQYQPNEGLPAAEPTEVLVLYTRDAIYFGIRAFDSQPDKIPAIKAQRDRGIFGDDWVRIQLDTFGDERQAYLFYVNPLGIQADALWIEGAQREPGRPPVDFNPDFIWDSRGRVTETGWVAEIRIPYLSIQFPSEDVQTWRLNVTREVRRLGYRQAWAPLTRNVSNQLSLAGRLNEMTELTPKRLVEITPEATARVDGAHDDEAGEFVRDGVTPAIGGYARYGITNNLTFGGTVNPDFAQVEADADQITVNERFAIFFPERRPFFLDGVEVFETPQQLVHTRRIIDPIGGAKVTGKAGPIALGYLGALDQSPGLLEPGDSDALFNLARARVDAGGSNVGVLYTDRTRLQGGPFNRVAAIDSRLLLGERHVLTTQAAGSWTRVGEAGDPSLFGPLAFLGLQRSGRYFNWALQIEDIHPEFVAASGFIRRTGDLRTALGGGPTFYTSPGSVLESVGFELRYEGFQDHRGFWSGEDMAPYEAEVELQTSLSFRGGRSLWIILREGYFQFRDQDFPFQQIEGPDGELVPMETPASLEHMFAGGGFTRWRFSNEITLGGSFFYREVPIFAEGSRGREIRFSPSLNLRPTTSMQLDLSYSLSRLYRSEDGSFFSSADIPRLRFQYQFSRAFFTRVILQYSLEERVELRDPTTGQPIFIVDDPSEARSSGDFLGQLLIAYEPAPRTVVFLGWSRLMEGPRRLGFEGFQTTTEGFFAKVSYLFRI